MDPGVSTQAVVVSRVAARPLHWVRRRSPGAVVLGLIGTPISVAIYLLLPCVMAIAPRPRYHKQNPKPTVDPGRVTMARQGRARADLMGFIILLYRSSYLLDYLERDGPRCRFIPSCTDYALRATAKYGLWDGLLLAIDRMRYCNRRFEGDYLDFP
jgi:uncharacterized protein